MGLMESFGKALGFSSLGPLQDVRPEDRAKMAEKRMHGEKYAEEKKALKESRRILQLTNYTPSQKLRLPDTKELRYKDGTMWLNLVLALYDQDKSIIGEVIDLPGDVRRTLSEEKAKRDTMSDVKQKLFDAAAYTIEKGTIFELPHAKEVPPIKTPGDNEAPALDKAA